MSEGPARRGRLRAPDWKARADAWILAARPRTLHAAAAPVFVGGGLAWADDAFRLLPFAAVFAGGLLIQVGTNLANDYSDYMRGADTEDRVGTPRAVQAGLIAPAAMRRGSAATFGLATLLGVYLVSVGGWPVVAIGLASIVAGIAYTGGPWPYGYRGLGDLAVFLFFGLVATGGTYWVLALGLRPGVLVAGCAVGALNTSILVINNLRDRGTDESAGKRTLAVVLGEPGSRVEYTVLLFGAAAGTAAGVAGGLLPRGALVALPAFATLVAPLRTVWSFEDPRALNAVLAATARATGVYGALFALGCLL